ncbi:MAG TPA: hypothetical protein VFH08_03590 [Chitinophagaceae bacterium]|nr:hypothetical protein [Chitinophagaceae bacterium]
MQRVFVPLLLLLFCVIFITCKKEYSYEGGGSPPPPSPLPPPAGPVTNSIFTLTGAPSDCQNFIPRGNYISDKALASSNSIDVHVNVTAIGNYTLTTDTIDGIWFSASGTFINTGDQIITLAGNGTPEFARNLLFTLRTANSACTFKLTVVNDEPLAIYVLESGPGNPNSCLQTISGNYHANMALSNSNSITIRVYVIYRGNFTIATNVVNGMIFSSTGRFTTIGSQDVILYGNGIPLSRGTYTLIPEIVGPHPLGGETCGVSITVN